MRKCESEKVLVPATLQKVKDQKGNGRFFFYRSGFSFIFQAKTVFQCLFFVHSSSFFAAKSQHFSLSRSTSWRTTPRVGTSEHLTGRETFTTPPKKRLLSERRLPDENRELSEFQLNYWLARTRAPPEEKDEKLMGRLPKDTFSRVNCVVCLVLVFTTVRFHSAMF